MTCKKFCDGYIEKQKKLGVESRKKLKNDLDKMCKKVKSLSGKRKINMMRTIKNFKSYLKYVKEDKQKIEKIRRESCNDIYCNPGCKGMMFENNPEYPLEDGFYTKLPSAYVKKIRNEGAISGCIRSKPLLY